MPHILEAAARKSHNKFHHLPSINLMPLLVQRQNIFSAWRTTCNKTTAPPKFFSYNYLLRPSQKVQVIFRFFFLSFFSKIHKFSHFHLCIQMIFYQFMFLYFYFSYDQIIFTSSVFGTLPLAWPIFDMGFLILNVTIFPFS